MTNSRFCRLNTLTSECFPKPAWYGLLVALALLLTGVAQSQEEPDAINIVDLVETGNTRYLVTTSIINYASSSWESRYSTAALVTFEKRNEDELGIAVLWVHVAGQPPVWGDQSDKNESDGEPVQITFKRTGSAWEPAEVPARQGNEVVHKNAILAVTPVVESIMASSPPVGIQWVAGAKWGAPNTINDSDKEFDSDIKIGQFKVAEVIGDPPAIAIARSYSHDRVNTGSLSGFALRELSAEWDISKENEASLIGLRHVYRQTLEHADRFGRPQSTVEARVVTLTKIPLQK